VRAVVDAIPQRVRYSANVTGSADGLLRRAERAVELGAGALVVNAFAQGPDAVRLLRDQAGRMADSPEDVRAQIEACHASLGVPRSVAVLRAGVSPQNTAAQVEAAGTRAGVMVLLGSAAYAHPGGPREGVAAYSRSGAPVTDPIPRTIELLEGHVRLIDQRRVPAELVQLELHTVDELCDAIRTLAVRGAPALGAAGAMGHRPRSVRRRAARPRRAPPEGHAADAVNLAWGVDRALAADDPAAEPIRIATEDVETTAASARTGRRCSRRLARPDPLQRGLARLRGVRHGDRRHPCGTRDAPRAERLGVLLPAHTIVLPSKRSGSRWNVDYTFACRAPFRLRHGAISRKSKTRKGRHFGRTESLIPP
jgi:hypothetical protein